MKTALITGAAGFIGHFLVKEFINDYKIICVVRPSSNLIRLDEYRNQIEVIDHDILQGYDNIWHRLQGVDLILHAGGNPSSEASIIDPVSAVMDNVVGTARVLELARKLPLSRFFYYGAAEIFGPIPQGTESGENDAYNTISPYAASKIGGEELCVAYANTYGVPISIIHITNTFGPRSQCNRLPVMAINRLLNDLPVDIHVGQDGTPGGRRWLYAGDVAAHTRFILDNQKTVCEKWNSSGSIFISNVEFVNMIATVMGKTARFNMIPNRRAGHLPYFSITPAKLYEAGWQEPLSTQERLAETVRWYQTNTDWLTRK